MRIVLDLQGAQAESRQRGIGRYSLSLATAIARIAKEHEVLVALNGAFPESIEPIRTVFEGLLPQKNIHVWQSLKGGGGYKNNSWHRSAEFVREAFLLSLAPDVVHVSSLFEGLVDDTVTSVGTLVSALPTAVTLYDLIPYVHRDTYLADKAVAKWYEDKLAHLRRADVLLAISESSRREAIALLDLPEDSIVNISSATEERFRPISFEDADKIALLSKYGLQRPFVMYTGGIDPRKNVEKLIEAFSALPKTLLQKHQLAIVCAIQPQIKLKLERLAKQYGLGQDDLVITGFIPEMDLVALYNFCKLFVFPSWHEGFGLPVLEAMQCGAAVIGANVPSLSEVIGRDDALFDPHVSTSIGSKMQEVLTDDALRLDLSRYGLSRAKQFSWDITARRAVDAFEKLHAKPRLPLAMGPMSQRPTLAYVSPLPPQHSGIADYSAELLPSLAQYYKIIAITPTGETSDSWIAANCVIQRPQWLQEHAHEVDRVLYHFGNSEFHEHMFGLIKTVPGTVVLHDFFLSGIQEYRESLKHCPHLWAQALYHSHGYKALKDRYYAEGNQSAVWQYPANLDVLQSADGIIVHSESSRRLADQWYGNSLSKDWALIPHLRVAASISDKRVTRQQLGLPEDAFLVCSFGLLGPTKLNHRLLSAWLQSSLARDPRCMLLFVGENNPGEYGRELLKQIKSSDTEGRIRIIGWADTDLYRAYLAAADVGVQLRGLSRGETSGTVLDCLNHGLATIVNANGSMADICDECVWKLPDTFSDQDLVTALQTLAENADLCQKLSINGRRLITEHHSPQECVNKYHAAIERFWLKGRVGLPGLVDALSSDMFVEQGDTVLKNISTVVAENYRMAGPKQLLLDISELVQHDRHSSIQLVVKNILIELINAPPPGFRVEPVFAVKGQKGYSYASAFTSRLLNCPDEWATDLPIDTYPGDIFVGLDSALFIVPEQKLYLENLRNRGVTVCFIAYDLLPISHPQYFVADAARSHANWLNTIDQFDKIITLSKAVADELQDWLDQYGSERHRPLTIDWLHLGADVNNVRRSSNQASRQTKAPAQKGVSFLMVGTIEPRKGHELVLDAFEQMWADGVKAKLVIVGKQGLLVDDFVARLKRHPQLGRQLIWEATANDARLELLYSTSSCLIAASAAEGFGLPLIEAAKHGLAIIARDIPVFREIAGEHAFYFDACEACGLASLLRTWLVKYEQKQHPRSEDMPWLTWQESAQCLTQILLHQEGAIKWLPPKKPASI